MAMASEEAVSPVLGVVLMVAVTTVLATTVFVIANGIAKTEDQAPVVQFLRDNVNGQLTVIQAYRPVDLSKIEVRSTADARFGYEAAPSVDVAAGTFVPFSPTPGQVMQGGDIINFCRVGGWGQVDVTIRVREPSDILVYQNTFTNLVSC